MSVSANESREIMEHIGFPEEAVEALLAELPPQAVRLSATAPAITAERIFFILFSL